MSAAESRVQYDRTRLTTPKRALQGLVIYLRNLRIVICLQFQLILKKKKNSLIYATHEKNPFGIRLYRICDSLLILNDNGVSRGQ